MSTHSIKVLLIEDSPSDTLLVRASLSAAVDARFEVTAADHLKRAMELVNARAFDVILLDLGLPDTQGIETFERMHTIATHIPIIVMSGLGDEEVAMRAVQHGGQDYFPKGVPLDDLLPRSIRYAIERHRAQTERDLHARAVKEVSEKYTELYDFAPVGYFTLDASSTVITANLTGADLVGFEQPLVVGLFFSMLVIPEKRQDFLIFLERVFAKNHSQTIDTEISLNDGKTCSVSIHARRSTDDQECLIAVADISERVAIRKQQATLLRQSRKQERRLRNLSHQIMDVQEEERKRISRELHDVIAQSLVGVNVELSALAQELSTSTDGTQLKIANTLVTVKQAVETVHSFARELRPAMLDDLGLIPTLTNFIKCFITNTGIRVKFESFAAIENYSEEILTTLFRIVQQALSNIVSHAHASEVQISILPRGTGISMEITDNGIGFDTEKYQLSKGRRRLGLLGMQERAEMVGGTFSIKSTPEYATTIRVLIAPSRSGKQS
jgi:two-component system sensor histidine kinase UhpB